MPKLQRIKRSNGSLSYSVNIPLEIIEQLEWEKGTDLEIEIRKVRVSPFITIFRKGGEQDVQEEKSNAEIRDIQGSE